MHDDQRTDAELLAIAATGGDRAFASLVHRYIRAATLLAAQLVGDRDAAEDIVQQAFIVVHRRAGDFDSEKQFAPWLFTIVRRIAANANARDTRRARLLRWWQPASDQARAQADTDIAIDGVDPVVVSRAMRELSPMQRACFELVAMRDLSVAEVATMHGIAESTVRQHVFRARAALRQALDAADRRRSE